MHKNIILSLTIALLLTLTGCSTNPATGKKQFTAFMNPQQEARIGAQQHQAIVEQFGGIVEGPLQKYVQDVGDRLVPHTELKGTRYRFTLLDTPELNAFASPGGYVYVTRGILSYANNEAELAAVIGHEIGHVTGRHSAAHVSRGALVSIGATILSTVIDNPGIGDATGLGSELYMKSHSREHEHEADALGVRYIHRAGYDPHGMARFMRTLGAASSLDQKIEGKDGKPRFSYFSTHPYTPDRVKNTIAAAGKYPANDNHVGHESHLRRIDGMTFGDSEKQGFSRGRDFYHPVLGFTFRVPEGFRIQNGQSKVIAENGKSSAIVFDMDKNSGELDPMTYLTQIWLNGETLDNIPERLTIGNMNAATATKKVQVNGYPATMRLVAVHWSPQRIVRFTVILPDIYAMTLTEEMKRTTYSLRRLTPQEKKTIRPDRIRIVTAKAGDTVASLSRRMPAESKYKQEQFRVLNGMGPKEPLHTGRLYKVVE